MSSPEAIYLNYGQEGEVVADIPNTASLLLNDRYSYGVALAETMRTLGVVRYEPLPYQAVLIGSTQEVADHLPNLVESADYIARTASYEQAIYNRTERQRVRIIVHGVLSELVRVMPDVVTNGEFIDVCEEIILPFARVSQPEGVEVRIVRAAQAPWRMTHEERLVFKSSVAKGAEHYLRVMGGK